MIDEKAKSKGEVLDECAALIRHTVRHNGAALSARAGLGEVTAHLTETSAARSACGRPVSMRAACLTRSTAPSKPTSCASMPTASMHESGPRPPVISRSASMISTFS